MKMTRHLARLVLLLVCGLAWAGDTEFDPWQIYDMLDLQIYRARGVLVCEHSVFSSETMVIQTNWIQTVDWLPSTSTNNLPSWDHFATNVFYRIPLESLSLYISSKVRIAESEDQREEETEAPTRPSHRTVDRRADAPVNGR